MSKMGRNDPCPCGSGEKYKRCCLEQHEAAQRIEREARNAELSKRARRVQELFAIEAEREELALGAHAMVSLVEQGQIDRAFLVGRDLLMRQKGGHEDYEHLARGCVERGQMQEAIQWYQKAQEAVAAHPERYTRSTAKRYRMLIQMLGGPGDEPEELSGA